MAAPRLNRPLVLEVPQRSPDGAGGFVETWSAQGTLWADLSARTGRETEGTATNVGLAALRITVRAAPQDSPRRPQAGQRLRDGARLFNILAVTEQDARARLLTCWAEEEVVT
ncbi:MAG: head-tail adaptor protein [Roseovarius sp.]